MLWRLKDSGIDMFLSNDVKIHWYFQESGGDRRPTGVGLELNEI